MSQKKTFYYKGIRVNAFGIPVFKNQKHSKKISTSLKRSYHPSFIADFKDKTQKNLIVMYDIPSDKKKERDWFRRQLKNFDYIMIQKSVWVGPSPLPSEFLTYVKTIGLRNKLKTFKLAKPYSGKETIFS